MSKGFAPPPEDVSVWEIYKRLGEQCEHFNTLQSTYRTLASTWLLATFGGIGFVLKEAPTTHPLLLVAALAGAGSLGIFLLWLLDLLVYHRLLEAAFSEQLRFETHYPWLPQVAHGMMSAHGSRGVLPKLIWFYVGPFAVLVASGSMALAQSFASSLEPGQRVTVATMTFAVMGGLVSRYMYRAATRSARTRLMDR